MKVLTLLSSGLGIALAAALLAGCGVLRQAQDDNQLPAVQNSGLAHRAGSSGYQLLHAFGDPGRLHRNAGGVYPTLP